MKADQVIAASGFTDIHRSPLRRRGLAACARAVWMRSSCRSSAGFTLTEVLIALALISFMLVGISRIFTMTSNTISTGQGVSQAFRGHRSIQQTLSNDLLGYSATGNIDQSDNASGMAPMVLAPGQTRGAPFFTISNFRISTYRNQKDYDSAAIQAPLTATNLTATASRSIRTILNSDGTQRVLPLYDYGMRNFRTDTFGFFSLGEFRTQTGSATASTYIDDGVTSDAAYIHYGQLRVFNGNAVNLGFSPAHGHPGTFWTPASGPRASEENKNNRFAEQFMLGRTQNLLIEPLDYYGTAAGQAHEYQYKTIVANNDVTKPVFFARRNWDNPTDYDKNSSGQPIIPTGTADRPTLAPIQTNSLIYCYSGGQNRVVDNSDIVGGSNGQTAVFGARADVFGAGLSELRQRAEFMVDTEVAIPPTFTSTQDFRWHTYIPSSWTDRFIVNPFAAMSTNGGHLQFDARRMGQRQHLLAECVTQLIVEYAGDFVTQSTNGTVAGGTPTPDGILDFVVVNDVRQTRWYGMPRDVNGDGSIPGPGNAARYTSPDVIPLCDVANTRRTPTGADPRPSTIDFEKSAPPINSGSTSDYLTITAEPAANSNPDDTSYVCVWGPKEFETGVAIGTETLYPVPQLVRIIVEISDPKARLNEPVTQEYVFPVKIKE